MATVNFSAIYRWDNSVQDHVLYTPGTTTDLSVSTLFKFPGTITGSPIKFRFYPTNSASTTIFLSTGTSATFPTISQNFSFSFVANTWNEVTFNGTQVDMLGSNTNIYVEMYGYTSPIVHTTGGNIPHIQTTDPPPTTPPTVSNIKLAGGTSDVSAYSTSPISLSWSGADGQNNPIQNYEAQYQENDSGNWYSVQIGTITTTSLTVYPSNTVGAKRNYRVRAIGLVSSSGWLTSTFYLYCIAEPPPTTPPTVSNVKLAGGTSDIYADFTTAITLSWTGAPGQNNPISRYEVEYSENDDPNWYDISNSVTNKYLSVYSSSTAGVKRKFRVRAIGSASSSGWAESASYLYAVIPVNSIRYWNGIGWVSGTIKFYDGVGWKDAVAKTWNGTSWVSTQ